MTVTVINEQRQQQLSGVGVDEDRGGEQAHRQHKLGLRNRNQITRGLNPRVLRRVQRETK